MGIVNDNPGAPHIADGFRRNEHHQAKGGAGMTAPGSETILIVDDAPENLSLLSDVLQPLYRVLASTSGAKALRIAATTPRPDLILLDVMMPGLDGYQVFARLRADAATHDIPVIFVTAMDGTEAEIHGFQAGAVDYITKPIEPSILLARVHNQLELKQARDWLRDQNTFLEAEVARRLAENETIQEVSIRALAHLAETRDPETGYHIIRTQGFVQRLAIDLQHNLRFAGVLTDRYIKLLSRSAPLHDIGKVGIPDAILRKPGPLTPEEWEIMRTHAQLGCAAIELAEHDSVEPVEFLSLAKEIAHWHHERWDGSGYPDGLAGEAIPVSARIMAVADMFDALISARVYKGAMSCEEARDIIAAQRGRHFDPDMVDAFLADFGAFRAIADRHRDPAASHTR
jgi:putative two-component system response regulator